MHSGSEPWGEIVMLIQYVGQQPLPLTLPTPIPFVSHSTLIGELIFNPSCEVPNDEWANFLLTQCGDAFQMVETEPVVPTQEEGPPVRTWEPPIGRRFNGKAGKWNGFTYLRNHKLGETHGLRKRNLGDKVFGWELVPIALADVGLQNAPVPWNKPQEGQEGIDGNRDRDDQGDTSDAGEEGTVG